MSEKQKIAEDFATQASSQLEATHHTQKSRLQHMIDRMTAIAGHPRSVLFLMLFVGAWIAANTVAGFLYFAPVDPVPFVWLQALAGVMGLYASLLILSTQRSEAVLADARAKLILEVAIAAEQKSAKIIQLLEEARRDNPLLADRNDDQAHDMSSPTDPQAILAAIGNDSEKIRGKEPCPTAPSAP